MTLTSLGTSVLALLSAALSVLSFACDNHHVGAFSRVLHFNSNAAIVRNEKLARSDDREKPKLRIFTSAGRRITSIAVRHYCCSGAANMAFILIFCSGNIEGL
jgi:hypothetical protein